MAVDRTLYPMARITVAFVWFYHGLVPKLLGPHRDELAMNMALGLNHSQAVQMAYAGGIAELLFAAVLLLFWQHRWPLLVSALSMVLLLVYVCLMQPVLIGAAFNPVTTNMAVLVLSVIAYRLHEHRPVPGPGSEVAR